jgi:multicomponent K+:H+ antiporter subunit D
MSHLVIAPVLLPLFAGILVLITRHLHIRWRRVASVAAVLGQIALAGMLLGAVSDGSILTYALGNWPAPYGIVLVADRLAAWMLAITSLLALCAVLYASRGADVTGRHFHVLFQLQLMGLNGAFLTGDLFNLFVFFEVLLLASYGLMLHGGGRLRTEAGLHYVILNLAGSALFLIAVGALYGLFGTLNMADLALKMASVSAENLGPARAAGLLLFVVFALKAALLPLHLWLPAAYSRTSAPVAALFAIMTKVGAYSILRVSTLMFGAQAGAMGQLIEPWLLPLALATLLVGMLGVLAARGLREQMAYLVIASAGTLLTAFSLGSAQAIAAGLYYLPHSVFAGAALFLLADHIVLGRGELADRFEPGPAMAGAGWLAGLFFVAALLGAGLPPLSGFVGKFLLLKAALAHPAWPWVFASVLSAGLLAMIALARTGSLLFMRVLPPEDGALPPPALRIAPLLPLLGLLALGVALTVLAGPIHALAEATAEQLLEPYRYVHAVLGVRP